MKQTGYSIQEAFRRLRTLACRQAALPCGVAWLILAAPVRGFGDQVEMQNGDHYVGKVLALNGTTLVVQNDVLGTLRLPREKVAVITFGPVPAAQRPPTAGGSGTVLGRPSAASNNAAPEASSPFRQLAAHTNMVKQIQSQFLSDAGPEANKKFEELLNGLMTGKLNMDDLRSQAQSAADQLRALKRESGEDPGFAVDSYLAILDHFLKSTPPSGQSGTNTTSKAMPIEDEK